MLEDLVRLLNRLALLSDQLVVLLCAHLSLYSGTFVLARIVGRSRCFSDASGDGIVLVERCHVVVF
jgi:hypothetical protein